MKVTELKTFFAERGLTQNQIAKDLGCAQTYVSAMLNGNVGISKRNAQKFKELYGLNPSWLLTGCGDMMCEVSGNDVAGENIVIGNNNRLTDSLSDFFILRNISKSEIAKQMNIGISYVSNLFSGRTAFGKQTATKFQELYGISAAWLLTGDGEMIIDPSKVPPIVDDAHNKVRARMEKAMIKDNKVSGQNIIVGNGNEMQTKSSNDEIAALKARVAQLEEENRWLRSVVESGMIKK